MSNSHITDNRGPQVIGISVAMIILPTLAVALRLWSRKISRAGLWWDDWTVLLALPFEIAVCAISIYWVSIGFGKHIYQAKGSASSILLISFCENFMYHTGLTLVKVSVLLFYSRVFTGVRWFTIALWFTGAMVASWWIIINFVALFTCDPIAKLWDSTIPGHCMDIYQTHLGSAMPNVVTDIILLILPMPILWKLHTTNARKVALSLVFGLGYCVVMVSIFRLVTIVKLGETVREDFSWTFVTSQLMIIVEIPIATISVCLPGSIYLIKQSIDKCQFYWSDISRSIKTSKTSSGSGTLNLQQQSNSKEDESEDITRFNRH